MGGETSNPNQTTKYLQMGGQLNNPIPTNGGRHFEPRSNGLTSINGGKHFKPQDINLNVLTKIAHITRRGGGGRHFNPPYLETDKPTYMEIDDEAINYIDEVLQY